MAQPFVFGKPFGELEVQVSFQEAWRMWCEQRQQDPKNYAVDEMEATFDMLLEGPSAPGGFALAKAPTHCGLARANDLIDSLALQAEYNLLLRREPGQLTPGVTPGASPVESPVVSRQGSTQNASEQPIKMQDIEPGLTEAVASSAAPAQQSKPAEAKAMEAPKEPEKKPSEAPASLAPGAITPALAAAKPHVVDSRDAVSYLSAVRARFPADSPVYKEFLSTLTAFKKHHLSNSEASRRISKLFEDEPELLAGFRLFVPKEAEDQAAKEQEKESLEAQPEGVKKEEPAARQVQADKLCSMEASCHVYAKGEDVYDVMLYQSNIGNNNNKFYIIQLLESDSSSPRSYYLWTRWGRVGQNGQNALQDCGADLSRALTAFHAKFTDKTKQVWAERKGFVAQPGKYAMAKRESAEGDYKPEGKSSSSSTALADPHEVAAPAIPTAPLFGSSPFFSSSQPAFGVQQVFNGQDVAKQPQMSNSNLFPYAQPAFQLASGGKRAHGQKQRFSAAHQQLQQQQQQQQQQQGWGGFSQGFHNGGLNSGPFGSLQPNAAQPSSNQFSFGQRAPFAFPNPAAAASSIPFGRFGSGFGNGPAFGTPAEDASLKAAMEASLMEYNVNQAKKVTQVLVGQAVSNGGRSAKEMEVEELERVLRESALEVQKSGGLNLAQHHTQSTGASNLRSDDGDAEDCIVVRSQVFSPSELANRLSDDSVLFLHPSDMQSLGLIRGDLAWLNSTVDAERGALLVAVDDHDIRKEHCSFHPHVSKVCFGSAAGKSGPSSAKLRDEDFVLSKCDAVPAAVSVQLLEVDSAGEPLLPSSIHTNPLPPLRDYLQPYFSTHYRPLTTRYQFTTPYKGDLDLIGMQPKHWRVVAMVEKDGKQTDKAVVEPETTLKFLSCAPPSSSGVVANQPAFECAVNENVEKKLQARQQAEAKVAAVVPAKPAEPVKAEEAKPAASVSPAAASKPAEASSEAAPAKALEDVIRSSFTPNSVDYFCPLRDTHHVYHAATFSHSVTLSQIHPSLNQSKYYVMQLLESNTLPHQFAVFFRWGRTPKTNPGQHMVEQCESLLDASAKFAQKFKDKTANAWPQTRETFQLHKGKYVIARDDDPIVNGSAAEASKPSASAAPTAPVAFADPSLFRQTKLNFAPAALSANPAAVAPESKPAPFAAAPPAGAPPAAAADAASSDSPVSSIPGGPSIHPALRAFQADLDEAQMSRAALVAEVEELRAMVKQSNESGSSVALTLAQADIAKLRAELAELKNADVGGLTTQVAQLTRQNASLLACLEQSTVPLQSEISRLKQENSTLRLKVTDLEFSFAVEQSLKQPAHRNANKFVCFHCANQPPQDRFEIEKSLMAEMEAKLAAGQAILPAATAQASPSPIAPAASSTSTSSSSSSSTTTNAPSTPPRVPASTSTSAHSPDTIASPPAVPPEVLSPTDWVSEDEEEQEQEEEGWELATKSPSPDATK